MKNNTNKNNYEKIREIATISTKGLTKKKLNFIAWNGNDPKYDLRTWITRQDGGESPKKGVTLNFDELIALKNAIEKEIGNQH